MSPMLVLSLALLSQGPAPAPKDIARSFEFGGQTRSYHAHLPGSYDPQKPTPLVVVLHGAGTDGKIMEQFCGMSEQADKSGFIACYPNGTGFAPFLTWNAGSFPTAAAGAKKPDDIGFLRKVLDDVATVANIDAKRVYVVGMSNGGMMAYRAAAEMSDRFAAMASVTGTLVIDSWTPKHPMPVLEIHGTKDGLVPYEGTKKSKYLMFPPIEEVVRGCAKFNGIEREPMVTRIIPGRDDMKVEKRDFGKGKNGAEVVFYVLEGGGHVWPGRHVPSILGQNTFNLDACETIWEFVSRFKRE
jgi:polyhydroxybutyrate depolymerase